MNEYITRELVSSVINVEELAKLSNNDGNMTVPNEEVISRMIDYTNQFLDDSLRGTYELPLNYVPDTIKEIGVQIFIFKLYGLRKDITIPEQIADSYTQALQLLRDYSTGNGKALPVDVQNKQVVYTRTIVRQKSPSRSMMDRY